MVKKGFAPEWRQFHTIAIHNYKTKAGDQAKASPVFTDFGNVIKWLDDKA